MHDRLSPLGINKERYFAPLYSVVEWVRELESASWQGTVSQDKSNTN